ncbi:hypothetical protein TPA0910_21410 [Streptomyces hygroscopicus subsp. sporocinereus]|uniref:Uncharacterized protein n=1 Tax=Streptomyces hygroscopicus TaxID=1912 RepID=A0ABQ3TWJ0_STRHY|nr:hypothetical protein TPA0910_21410 [Streptomyces hygroscopicus]
MTAGYPDPPGYHSGPTHVTSRRAARPPERPAGRSVPGQSVPDQSVPGQSVPGQSAVTPSAARIASR